MKIINKKSGAVSLFIVIFVALLLTVITISFVRIMVQSQQQASSNDLSQSAYDSAQVGVEDAKRALLRYQSYCSDGANSSNDCISTGSAYKNINSTTCNNAVISVGAVESADHEVKVQTTSSAIATNALNQAYTCVTITTDTNDFVQNLQQDKSTIVPLKSLNSFNVVRIEWFNKSDNGNNINVTLDSNLTNPLFADWGLNRPSIMRAQLIQFASSFNLNDFNDTNISGQSNMNTLFLYPSSIGLNNVGSFATKDIRRNVNNPDNPDQKPGSPVAVECKANFNVVEYACSADLTLPIPIGGTGNTGNTAYLRLTSLYKGSSFRLSLYNGLPLADKTNSVKFNGVQPSIDSTGRANDMFRRVESRVRLMDVNFPFPDSEIDTTGNLCKDFVVTDNSDDYNTYVYNNPCSPAL